MPTARELLEQVDALMRRNRGGAAPAHGAAPSPGALAAARPDTIAGRDVSYSTLEADFDRDLAAAAQAVPPAIEDEASAGLAGAPEPAFSVAPAAAVAMPAATSVVPESAAIVSPALGMPAFAPTDLDAELERGLVERDQVLEAALDTGLDAGPEDVRRERATLPPVTPPFARVSSRLDVDALPSDDVPELTEVADEIAVAATAPVDSAVVPVVNDMIVTTAIDDVAHTPVVHDIAVAPLLDASAIAIPALDAAITREPQPVSDAAPAAPVPVAASPSAVPAADDDIPELTDAVEDLGVLETANAPAAVPAAPGVASYPAALVDAAPADAVHVPESIAAVTIAVEPVEREPDATLPEPPAATAPLPPAVSAAALVAAAAAQEARWRALAEDVRMQVLQRIDIFTDTGLQAKLRERVQPIVDRASAELVDTINRHVGQVLREYVAEAVEREIERWRNTEP